MSLPITKLPTKADNDCSRSSKTKRKIRDDIEKIEGVLLNDNAEEIKEMHMLVDARYSAYVPDWGHSMYGYIENQGFYYEDLGKESLKHNLTLMKHSLEGFILNTENATKRSYGSSKNSVNVTVNNSVETDVDISISITFEYARQQIENMTSLTDEQTHEILGKIAEIENAVIGNGTKKSKWEKLKPILIWLADKSFDVGMTLLPLLLKLGEQ